MCDVRRLDARHLSMNDVTLATCSSFDVQTMSTACEEAETQHTSEDHRARDGHQISGLFGLQRLQLLIDEAALVRLARSDRRRRR